MNVLVVGSAIVSLLSIVVSLLFIINSASGSGLMTASLAAIGLLGATAGVFIIYSNHYNGRLHVLGVAFAVCYLGASFAPPVALVTLHLYGPLAILLVVLTVWNSFKWSAVRNTES